MSKPLACAPASSVLRGPCARAQSPCHRQPHLNWPWPVCNPQGRNTPLPETPLAGTPTLTAPAAAQRNLFSSFKPGPTLQQALAPAQSPASVLPAERSEAEAREARLLALDFSAFGAAAQEGHEEHLCGCRAACDGSVAGELHGNLFRLQQVGAAAAFTLCLASYSSSSTPALAHEAFDPVLLPLPPLQAEAELEGAQRGLSVLSLKVAAHAMGVAFLDDPLKKACLDSIGANLADYLALLDGCQGVSAAAAAAIKRSAPFAPEAGEEPSVDPTPTVDPTPSVDPTPESPAPGAAAAAEGAVAMA